MIAWLRLFGFGAAVLGAIALPQGGAAAAKYAAIVVDAGTGEVLYARNADRPRFPASLAKMMTLYLTFEASEAGEITLDQALPISTHAAGQSPSRLGLRPGQTITVKQAILALVTKSANDVAAALAEALGGTERKFAFHMTRAARELGMKRTRFRNASGLPNRRQRSTARDLSMLARALIHDFPQYYHYFSTASFTFMDRTYTSHNRLLQSYPGTDGIKTGYIAASGFNVTASVQRGQTRLVGVVLGGKSARSRDKEMRRLFEAAFARLEAGRRASHPPPKEKPRPPRTVLAGPQAPLAPQVAAAAVAVDEENAGSPARTWGVQVGAFQSFAAAQSRAHDAAGAAGELLTQRTVRVVSIEGRDQPLFRARLTGLDEAEAKAACAFLREQNFECLTVPPSGPFAQGDR